MHTFKLKPPLIPVSFENWSIFLATTVHNAVLLKMKAFVAENIAADACSHLVPQGRTLEARH